MRRSYDDDRRSSALDALETLALIGALGQNVSPAVKGVAYRWRTRNPSARSESAVDESLEETFPASDPPASRYVDIPENRRE